jgi:hypothetical protein
MSNLGLREPLNLVVADKHPLFLEGLKIVFSKKSLKQKFDLITFNTLDDKLVEFIGQQKSKLLILGLSSSESNAIALITSIKKTVPGIRILILASVEDARFMRFAIRAGADGYLLKSDPIDQFINAIKYVLQGEIYIGKGLSLFNFPSTTISDKANSPLAAQYGLTKREYEIFMCLGDALSSNQIAEKLAISHLTVNIHRKNLMKKMKVASVPALVKMFYECQLLAPL